MKIDWNKKYNTIAVYTFIVAASIILFYLGISQIGAVTSYIGFAIAYLLGFLLKVYERNLKKIKTYRNLKLKYQRIISLILTYLTAILLIVLFLQFVLPQLIESIVGLVNNIPKYISNKFIACNRKYYCFFCIKYMEYSYRSNCINISINRQRKHVCRG